MILHGMTERTLDLLQIARANHFVLHSDHNQSTNAEQITPQSSAVQAETYHRIASEGVVVGTKYMRSLNYTHSVRIETILLWRYDLP